MLLAVSSMGVRGALLGPFGFLVAFFVGIVLIMGIAFVAPGLMPFLESERRPLLGRFKPGVASAYPLGLAFAAGWTPCVGPGLGVMLTLGAIQGSTARAALLLFFFSLGFGTWFILAALG